MEISVLAPITGRNVVRDISAFPQIGKDTQPFSSGLAISTQTMTFPDTVLKALPTWMASLLR